LTDLEPDLPACRPKLFQFFLANGGGGMAEDLASETILRVIAKIDGGLVVDSVRAYCYGVARLVLMEHLRGPDRRFEKIDSDRFQQPQPDPDREKLIECLEIGLARLAPDKRELLAERYGIGRPKRRVEEQPGSTANSLYIRIHRAKKELLPYIEDCMERSGFW